MCLHTQLHDKQVDAPEERQRIDELKTYVDESAEEHRQDESQYLIACDGAAEDAYRHESRAKQEKAYIGAQYAAAVDIADGHGEHIDGVIVDKGGQQGQQHEAHSSKEFGNDNLPIGERLGEKHLDGAGAVLLGKAAHGDSGNKEEEHPWGNDEEAVKVGEGVVEDVEVALEHPQEEACDEQEHHYHHDANQRAEEVDYLFFKQRVHRNVI